MTATHPAKFTCPTCGTTKNIRKMVSYCLDSIAKSEHSCVDCFGKASVDHTFRARIVR